MEASAHEYVEDKYEAYELIDGEVYMMSRPSLDHIQIGGNIYTKFKNYLRGKRCRAFNEAEVHLSEKDHVIPDVVIVCNPDILKKNSIDGTPDLVVEILSPSTELKDRSVKFFTYEKYGVKEYWLVEPKKKAVDVYRLRDGRLVLEHIGCILDEEDTEGMDEEQRARAEEQKTIKVSLYDDFVIDVADVFEDVD